MSLKYKISAATFEKMEESVQKLYSKDDENYKLNVDGLPDFEREQNLREKAETRASDLQKKLDEIDVDGFQRKEAELKESHAKEVAKLQATIAKNEAHILATAKSQSAKEIAAKISNAPDLLLPHIESNIHAELKNGQVELTYKTSKGEAVDVENFSKDFQTNDKFSAIIIGSKASGTSGGSKLPSFTGADGKPLSFNDMSRSQQVEYLKAKRESANEGKE